MNRIFRKGRGNLVPDGTLVYPFLNPTDSTNDLPVGLFDDVSIALGEIGPGQSSKIQVHPAVTVIIWVVDGDLRLKMKDTGTPEPYCLELRTEDGALALPGTFFQLINPGRETCRLIYVVTPPYVFLETQGKLVYDDAIVVDCDWDTLAAQRYQSPGMDKPDAVQAKRRKAVRELCRRKGSAKRL
jgi:mannose-6-phosphate isomerase-like protein (cupin superfamily)